MNSAAKNQPKEQDTRQSDVATGEYVYCVIRPREPRAFATRGIGERGDAVRTIHFKGLAAVASASPVVEYEGSRRNMMAHTLVLEEVMQDFTVLPVRFGTVAPSEETIREKLLGKRYEELNGLVEEMRDRVEMGLKAFWYEDVIFGEIVDENADLRRLRDSLAGRSPEETYYDRIRVGEMVERAMVAKRVVDTEKILSRLRPLTYKTKLNKTITDRMVLNGAFLLDQDRDAAFDQAVKELDGELSRRLIFKYVGPVPPYNFVNIVVHWQE